MLRLSIVIGLLLPAPQASAQAEVPLALRDRKLAAVCAAVQMVAIDNPLAMLALRAGGLENLVWIEFEPQRVPPLDGQLLLAVKDNRPILDLRGKAPDEIPRRDREEYQVLCQALLNARDTAPELFEKEAKEDENRSLTAGQLLSQPGLHRGKVVHLAGRVARIERVDAPLPDQDQGMKSVYESWVVVNRIKNPVCVLFAQLPDGLQEAESMDQHVSFDGYFFKRYAYKSEDKVWRYTLLFIAPTLKPDGPTAASTSGMGLPTYVYYVIAGLGCGTIMLVVGLSWFFRRSDQKLRRRLAEVQAARALEMGFGLEDEEPANPAEPEA